LPGFVFPRILVCYVECFVKAFSAWGVFSTGHLTQHFFHGGAPVLEVEDYYTVRRIVVSDMITEENRAIERLVGRTLVYKTPLDKLEHLATQNT
jgi:hypothetical protein